MSAEPRKIVVVGAGSGIGAATAEHFHARGDVVAAIDIRTGDAPATRHLTCDLRDPDSVENALESLGDGWDVLAHVAGIPGTAAANDVLAVNYLGMRRMVEGMLPRMRSGGSIVTVASTAALGWEQRVDVLDGLLALTDNDDVAAWQAGQDQDFPVYTTSKQATILFAKRISGPASATFGVRVNTVSPGPVETPILADFEASMGKDTLDFVRSSVGRHATVHDVVPLIDFLASPQARWVNGQDIQVDGGFIASMSNGAPIAI